MRPMPAGTSSTTTPPISVRVADAIGPSSVLMAVLSPRLDAFRTLAGPVEAEIREKGSRFLARAVPVTGRAAAEAYCAEQARAYRDATHVVPAFRLHDGTEYASDAGEPASSAGPPMLQALRGAGCTTSPPWWCAGTAARTSASAGWCAPTRARWRWRWPTRRCATATPAVRLDGAPRPRAHVGRAAHRRGVRRPRPRALVRRRRDVHVRAAGDGRGAVPRRAARRHRRRGRRRRRRGAR